MTGRNDRNIGSFDGDVAEQGVYKYYTDRLSCRLANARIDQGIVSLMDFSGLTVLDVGSGDGTTAILLHSLGAAFIKGIDPAPNAVSVATDRCAGIADMRGRFEFVVGDIDTYQDEKTYDVVVFSRVLHHLPDPRRAIKRASGLGRALFIVEPNGWNPVLKMIEKLSPYHRAHDEKSYTPATIRKWCAEAGFSVDAMAYVNLVPMFCPDGLARLCKFFEPAVEAIPAINSLCCGQLILHARQGV